MKQEQIVLHLYNIFYKYFSYFLLDSYICSTIWQYVCSILSIFSQWRVSRAYIPLHWIHRIGGTQSNSHEKRRSPRTHSRDTTKIFAFAFSWKRLYSAKTFGKEEISVVVKNQIVGNFRENNFVRPLFLASPPPTLLPTPPPPPTRAPRKEMKWSVMVRTNVTTTDLQ